MTTYPAGHSFGKYVVTRTLGRGGMAEVYQAHDPVLDRHVAIKLILPHLAAEVGFVARFLREAKLIASLRHQHLVQLFDFDVAGDQPFMVMEYLEGDTLKTRLLALRSRNATMPLGDIVHLLDALASALDYAHGRGSIHRDIKPANILFTEQGEPVLTDFGIAKLLGQTGQISMSGSVLGTPAYMAPEQAAGKAVDGRSDVYALGVVAYELATGRVPFQGDSPTAVLMQHLLEAPPPPRAFNSNLPVAVEQVILQALAKEPAARFSSAGAFAQAFRTAPAGKVTTGVSPEDATVVEQAKAASVSAVPSPTARPSPLPSLPITKSQPVAWTQAGPIFVARERELMQLEEFLVLAMSGQGQICFVTGEAGTGKTALVTEFARRAQMAHADLVIATGNCNTQSGVGDPYLPFREVLTRLVGLAENSLTGEVTVQEEISEPVGFRALSGRALADHGPDLIDIFVPGAALMAQMGNQSTDHSKWIDQLASLVQRKAQATGPETGVEQRHIFEQYTNVLTELAAQQPLMLVVDDLQWVDVASVDLLFHLSRRIGESPILLVGTYRPDEVALGRNGEQHPLQKVLAELKRYFGDLQVILPQKDEETGRQFVDSLLDVEPNRLNADFRQALFHHTGGHALFTVELLRNMQERGDLTLDTTGRWVQEPTLKWEKLPPRVEGVIEERIGRLAEELRDLLTIASIEGEDFTAEVVARVQDVDTRGIIRQLSRDLAQQHRLVGAIGQQRVGQQRLSLFRFQHNLFQKYLYNRLNGVERAYLHEDVGTVLEELYGDTVDTIAVQLAWHFTEADLPEKARHYLAIAGEQARRRYANGEALSYLNRALDLTPEADRTTRYTLLLARQQVYDVLGDREAQRQDLRALEALAAHLDDHGRQAEVALCLSFYADQVAEYRTSLTYAQKAIELAVPSHDIEREATGYMYWGRALLCLSDYPESQSKLQRAIALADKEELDQVKAASLRWLGTVNRLLGDYDGAAAIYQQALQINRAIGDQRGEGHILNNLGLTLREQSKLTEARPYFDRALQIYEEIGDRDGVAYVLCNLGILCHDQGNHIASRAYYEQSLVILRQTGARDEEALALLGIGDAYVAENTFATAASYYTEARQSLRAIGNRRMEYLALKELGNIARRQGDYETAHTDYEAALACFRAIGDRQSECDALNSLALLYHQLAEEAIALRHSQAALAIAQTIGDRWLESAALTRIGHALAGLGQPEDAVERYQEAIAHWREQGRPDLALASVAGLARIALARGDLVQAHAYAEELVIQFADDTFSRHDMAEEFLTCYRALQANGDRRAGEILSTIYSQLQASAAKIDDEAMRRSYLENISVHREIVSAWQAMQRFMSDE